jgi:uncharacterized membrane protein YfcA
MSVIFMAALCLTMIGTSFLSGIFGMAGGMILIGVLLATMSVPAAMVLHAVTQMASNGWRAILWFRHVRWKPVVVYVAGCGLALIGWSFVRYVPSTAVALLLLGAAPLILRLMPERLRLSADNTRHGVVCGSVCMALILLTGVSGPMIDSYFLGGKLDRREIVATKAMCQIFGHAAKLVYFGGIVDQAAALDPWLAGMAIAASMLGTTLASHVLKAMSDTQFRVWANRLIMTITGYYLVHGATLLIFAQTVAP